MTPTSWHRSPWYFQGAFLKRSEILQGSPQCSDELILSPYIPAKHLLSARQEALGAGDTTWRTGSGACPSPEHHPVSLGLLCKCRFCLSGPGWGPRACLANKLAGDTAAAGPGTTLYLKCDVLHPKEWLREIDAQKAI